MRTSPMLACALLLAAVGCGTGNQDELLVESPASEIRYDRDGPMAMAAAALDEVELERGMVIVPTDEAIFALDADALADLLAGGMTDLVTESAISIDYGVSIEDWPGELGDGSGPARAVTRADGTWMVDGNPVVDVWRRDGITVVVLDGVLDR